MLFPPFRILGTPKQKIFFSFLKKIGRAQNLKKCRENFSVLGRKLLQSLRAESGAKAKNRNQDFLQKKFEFCPTNAAEITKSTFSESVFLEYLFRE